MFYAYAHTTTPDISTKACTHSCTLNRCTELVLTLVLRCNMLVLKKYS